MMENGGNYLCNYLFKEIVAVKRARNINGLKCFIMV